MGRFDDYTSMGGSKYYFQTTIWDMFRDLNSKNKEKQKSAIEQIVELYWKPIYCWLRRRGYNNEDAKELTQEFFLSGIKKEKFKRADPTRGRFRTFLLKCLGNFVINYERSQNRKDRKPSNPIVMIDQFDTNELGIELFHTETPEDSFNRAWVRELLMRVLYFFKEECTQKGHEQHFGLFLRRIIEPILDNVPKPAIKDLAEEMGLARKQASNYLITARRAYHRLLRQEIGKYASTDEEVTLEIEDLFKFVAGA